MFRQTIFFILLFTAIYSCKVENRQKATRSLKAVEGQYATGFTIEEFDGYKILNVRDPWQGSDGVNFSYILSEQDAMIPDSLKGLPLIRIPVQRVICMSTTHIAMIRSLDKLESIVGISGRGYISDSELDTWIEEGRVGDVGADQALNYELIVSLQPDVLVAYGITSEISGMVKRLSELGIPVILNGDYLENHPLGKLEWIRFMAALYLEDGKADSIFIRAEQDYLAISAKASAAISRPSVMTGLPWKGSWYIPGGTSFAAAFIRDAGASFIWGDAPNHEALPLSLEAVNSKAGSADVWINCGSARSLAEIENKDTRLARFQPYKTGRVYNNTARLNAHGGNDIWETGVMEPHIILADLVRIFHPEILPDHELVYYEKLE